MRAVFLGILLVAIGCSSEKSPVAPGPVSQPTAPSRPPSRVLMLTATAGFRHDSIATARQVMNTLAATTGEFTVTATEDLSLFTASALAGYDVICY